MDELSRTKLIVLGLSWDTTDNALSEYFSTFGTVVKAEIMMDHHSGRSRGFGFVTFSSKEDANRVIEASHELDGRRIEPKLALPKGEASGRTESNRVSSGLGGVVPVQKSTKEVSNRIFVARIPATVTDESFKQHFEAFGSVQDAYMPKDHYTGDHRSIGFITFTDPASVDKVLAIESHEIEGCAVAVDRATSKTWQTCLATNQVLSLAKASQTFKACTITRTRMECLSTGWAGSCPSRA
mmetsp:Transcript_19616/g.27160  ORF Transcript_19616/g.27160 Transcript_19616/m.27160 type:complete len:240 (+) Transcript_19616:116-835(+)